MVRKDYETFLEVQTMARKSLKSMSSRLSGKLLNPTEHKAISKLMKIHEPMLKEMEKWKEQREKLETTLLDQIDTIGKILEPYYNSSRSQLMRMAGQQQPKARYSGKKTSSRKKTSARRSTKKSR